jgi:hypothetical protein
MLYEVLGDIWVVQRNPICRTTCWTTPTAASAGRGAAPPPGRDRQAPRPEADAQRDALVGELVEAARRAVREFDRTFVEAESCASACARRWAADAKDNIKFDGLSRVAT